MNHNHSSRSARNWLVPPLDYDKTVQQPSSSRLGPRCEPRQLLPTYNLTSGLRTWESEYSAEYSTLRPILLRSEYTYANRNGSGRYFGYENSYQTHLLNRSRALAGVPKCKGRQMENSSSQRRCENRLGAGAKMAGGSICTPSKYNPNIPNGGVGKVFKIYKAYIPEEGRAQNKLKPLEVVPKMPIVAPDSMFLDMEEDGEEEEEEEKEDGSEDAAAAPGPSATASKTRN